MIAEVGWLSDSIVAQASTGQCFTAITTDESLEARLSRPGARRCRHRTDGPGDVDFRSGPPVAPLMGECGCQQSAEWCTVRDIFRGPPPTGTVDSQLAGELLLKAFGTMGLRTYNGTVKPDVYRRWQQARALPIRGD